jgi:hypothetical protein
MPTTTSPGSDLYQATPFGFNEANPWYIGAAQGLTYDTNATRAQSPRSDTYSSTSVFGGFNQSFGRQQVFGSGHVTYNKYFDFSNLDNTQYNLAGGLNWETLYNLSGTVRVAFGQNATTTVLGTGFTNNTANTRDIRGTAAWGGTSSLSVEGMLGYSDTNYSNPGVTALDTSLGTASLALHYHGHGVWGTGIGVRYTQQRTPRAGVVGGEFVGNNVDGRNIDFYFNYNPGATLRLDGRLSYTKTSNSGLASADFSGWTGYANATWVITGKSAVSLYAARDVGYNTNPFSSFTLVFINNVPVLSPVNGVYENNQRTSSAGLTYTYLATAKITVNAGLRYSQAHLLTITLSGNGPPNGETLDTDKFAYIGASWAITRNWTLNANLSHEQRNLSGARDNHYTDNLYGLLAQYTWP